MDLFFKEELINKKLLERMKKDIKEKQIKRTVANIDGFFKFRQMLREDEQLGREDKQLKFLKLMETYKKTENSKKQKLKQEELVENEDNGENSKDKNNDILLPFDYYEHFGMDKPFQENEYYENDEITTKLS